MKGEFALYVSDVVIAEARDVMSRPAIVARLKFMPERATELLNLVERLADRVAVVPEVWSYDRDPDDAHYVNLALAAGAKLIVTRDSYLLDLMRADSVEGAKFQSEYPDLTILTPPAFLAYIHQA